MIVYVTMFLISIFFTLISKKSKDQLTKKIFYIMATLPFILVSAVRFEVGTDYYFRYVPNYLEFVHGRTVTSLEFLFVLIIKICVFVTKNPLALFIFTSIFINGFIFYTIFKYSKSPILSIVIYFFGSFFFGSMNILRQYMAMAILFFGYNYLLYNKNKKIFIALILMASLLHSMSIVFFAVFFLYKKPIKLKEFIFIVIGVTIFGRYLGDIVNIIINNTSLKNNINIYKYVKYFIRDGKLYLSTLISELAIYIFIYKSYIDLNIKETQIEKEAIFFLNMQSIVILTLILTSYYSLFFRVTLLFTIFQILSIPYFWSKFKFKKSKLLSVQTKSTIFVTFIIGILFIRMCYSNILKGADEVLPYRTIWNKNISKMEESNENINIYYFS